MKSIDVLNIATIALGTTALTLTAFWSDPTEAGHEADKPGPTIAQPRLSSHGVEFTLAPTGGRVFKAGEQPAFELTARNTTNEIASVGLSVTMTCSSVPDLFSRVIRPPAALWAEVLSLTLKPGETRVLTLETLTNLPPNSLISVVLNEAESNSLITGSAGQALIRSSRQGVPGVVALSFSTAMPKQIQGLAARQ